ncbi:MAG: NUDIX hydrolase [Dehalococcoidales bacterium]|jgi:ADP-ribose pyrophosphatase
MSDASSEKSRLYPKMPMAGVGAVVFRGERILLIKRGKEPSKGQWSIPGGVIELGESVSQAVKREVMEECSIHIEIERVLDAVDNIVKDPDGKIRYHYVIIDLLTRYASGELQAGDDAAECGWFMPGEAAGLDLTPSLRAMLERRGIIKKSDK